MNQVNVQASATQRTGDVIPAARSGPEQLASDASSEFLSALGTAGLHEALSCLNRRTRFRFTGVYRAAPPLLIIESLFDRENPSIEHCGGARQLEGTFCSIVIATGAVFATGDAPMDPQTEGYHVRNEVMSYCGAPIRTKSGRVAGVLCHYDLRLRLLSASEQGVLRSVTPHLANLLEPHQV